MKTEEKHAIGSFIGNLASKDYAKAQESLRNAVEAKIKIKIASKLQATQEK